MIANEDAAQLGINKSHYNLVKDILGSDEKDQDTPDQRRIRALTTYPSGAELAPPWDEVDISLAIQRANGKGAPGADGVTGAMVKQASTVLSAELTSLFNDCKEAGAFPSIWKAATVIVFTKKGPRDLSLPTSYRPICLLPVLGKVFESVIKATLTPILEPCLSDRQYGSRRGRSTEMAVNQLIADCNRDNPKYAIIILFDIAGAYDSAWWPAIMKALQEMDTPSDLFELIADYLRDRTATLGGQGSFGIPFETTKGCPQGSILGPLLWLAMFNGLLTTLDAKGISAVAYVDDLAIVVRANSRTKVLQDATIAASQVGLWCSNVKLRIAVEKTVATVAKGKFDVRHPPVIRINGVKIRFPEVITYLGVNPPSSPPLTSFLLPPLLPRPLPSPLLPPLPNFLLPPLLPRPLPSPLLPPLPSFLLPSLLRLALFPQPPPSPTPFNSITSSPFIPDTQATLIYFKKANALAQILGPHQG